MECHGNGPDHCCYIDGDVCPFLEEHTEGRRWVCGLLRELGSWDAVYRDRRYQRSAAAAWFREYHRGYGCGDWPQHITGLMTVNELSFCCFTGDGG